MRTVMTQHLDEAAEPNATLFGYGSHSGVDETAFSDVHSGDAAIILMVALVFGRRRRNARQQAKAQLAESTVGEEEGLPGHTRGQAC